MVSGRRWSRPVYTLSAGLQPINIRLQGESHRKNHPSVLSMMDKQGEVGISVCRGIGVIGAHFAPSFSALRKVVVGTWHLPSLPFIQLAAHGWHKYRRMSTKAGAAARRCSTHQSTPQQPQHPCRRETPTARIRTRHHVCQREQHVSAAFGQQDCSGLRLVLGKRFSDGSTRPERQARCGPGKWYVRRKEETTQRRKGSAGERGLVTLYLC